jgi:hypothetical protein
VNLAAVSLLLAIFAFVPEARAERHEYAYGVLPVTDELFTRVLADPRQAHTTARYYRNDRQNLGDTALGAAWGLARWHRENWVWQVNMEAMGYSRFKLSGGVNEFQTIDFFVNLPVVIRGGRFSSRLMIFHESSHLGDDYIRRTGDTGFRFSVEGVRAMAAYDLPFRTRVYGGGSVLFHSIPARQWGDLQWGAEVRSPDLHWMRDHQCWVYIAQDFKSRGRNDWNISSNTEIGLRVGAPKVIRAFRVHVGRFDGRSEFGQFHRQREAYWNLGVSFDFE